MLRYILIGLFVLGTSAHRPNRLQNRCWHGVFYQGILWNDHDNWVVYVNHHQFTPRHTRHKYMILKDVTEEHLTLRVRYGKSWHTVRLAPFHSYDFIRKKVHWGDCRFSEFAR